MGGAIAVQSEAGRGSTFTVELPLARIGEAEEAPAEAGACALAAATDRPLRILAAEDNPVNQLVLKTLLGQAGIDPFVVENGAEAVAAWERQEWDLILMDAQMPVMDGPEASRMIRAREADSGRRWTPIIALTANAMSHQTEAYHAAGMNGVVSKPINVGQLFAAIAQAVSTRSPLRDRPPDIEAGRRPAMTSGLRTPPKLDRQGRQEAPRRAAAYTVSRPACLASLGDLGGEKRGSRSRGTGSACTSLRCMRARIGLAGLASMLLVAAVPPSPAVREIEARANDQERTRAEALEEAQAAKQRNRRPERTTRRVRPRAGGRRAHGQRQAPSTGGAERPGSGYGAAAGRGARRARSAPRRARDLPPRPAAGAPGRPARHQRWGARRDPGARADAGALRARRPAARRRSPRCATRAGKPRWPARICSSPKATSLSVAPGSRPRSRRSRRWRKAPKPRPPRRDRTFRP